MDNLGVRPVVFRLAACFAGGLLVAALSPLAALAQAGSFGAEPTPQGVTPGEPQWIGPGGQVIEGEGAGLGVPDDAPDADGDGYKNYAEEHFNTNPYDKTKFPLDMTPEQANLNQKAIREYLAAKGRGLKSSRGARPGGRGSIVSRHPYAAVAAGVGVVGGAILVATSGGGDGGGDGGGCGVNPGGKYRKYSGAQHGAVSVTVPTPQGPQRVEQPFNAPVEAVVGPDGMILMQPAPSTSLSQACGSFTLTMSAAGVTMVWRGSVSSSRIDGTITGSGPYEMVISGSFDLTAVGDYPEPPSVAPPAIPGL